MVEIIYIVIALLIVLIFGRYITYILGFVSVLPHTILNLLLLAGSVQLLLLVIGRRKSS